MSSELYKCTDHHYSSLLLFQPLICKMHLAAFAIVLLVMLHWCAHLTETFPQGAPSEVCESFSPQRGHKVAPRPLSESPFRFVQYGRHYRRGDTIGVEILPHDDSSEGDLFAGFLVQALDPRTLQFIGHFLPGEGLSLMPECSAVTHRNNKMKTSASFLWVPPRDRPSGEVIFRATIVQHKKVYFQNMLAEVIEE